MAGIRTAFLPALLVVVSFPLSIYAHHGNAIYDISDSIYEPVVKGNHQPFRMQTLEARRSKAYVSDREYKPCRSCIRLLITG